MSTNDLESFFKETEEKFKHPITFCNQRHLNGYIYDSLMYRYIFARKQMAEYEYLRALNTHDNSSSKDWLVFDKKANRDIMRFRQILDEAMGEHD